MFKYFYYVFVVLIGTVCSAAVPAENSECNVMNQMNLPHFDIEKYKSTVPEGNSSYSITLPDGIEISYGDGIDYYYEDCTRQRVFERTRHFYKGTGNLKEERAEFHGISVFSDRIYSETGELVDTRYYTDADWVDRLVKKARDEYHLDLWNNATAKLFMLPYRGRWVLQIAHLNGSELKYPFDEKRNFVFLDPGSFDEIVRGEILYLTSGPGVRYIGFDVIPVKKYMVDGEPLSFN